MEGEKLIIPSENPDDAGTIPLYEQIYALAGLAQYYRISLDWEVLEDIRRTLNSFQGYYHDVKGRAEPEFPGEGGYFSHIDYATMRPDSPALGRNMSRKNWNSVGDHLPAYLVNLLLALDPGAGEPERAQARTVARPVPVHPRRNLDADHRQVPRPELRLR